MYYDMIHCIIQATDQNLELAHVVCDFEDGLITDVQTQFPSANIIECLFHLKQALRCRMKKLWIPGPEASIAMEAGVVDMLTVIDPDQIGTLVIAWVKREIKQNMTSAPLLFSHQVASFLARAVPGQHPHNHARSRDHPIIHRPDPVGQTNGAISDSNSDSQSVSDHSDSDGREGVEAENLGDDEQDQLHCDYEGDQGANSDEGSNGDPRTAVV